MILLSASDPNWADQAQAITGVVSVLLWAVYVYYTIKTFREIRRQTELQSEAFVILAQEIVSRAQCKGAVELIADSIKESSENWKVILSKNLPTAMQGEDNYLRIAILNRGRSDVVSWALKLRLDIEPGATLAKSNITGEHHEWEIRSDGSRHNIAPEKSLNIVVAQVGPLPVAKLSWSIAYVDSRGNRLSQFAGDKQAVHRNAFAKP